MLFIANGLATSKHCMPPLEPDRIEAADIVDDELGDASEVMACPRDTTDISEEDASTDGHRNLLMCMGSSADPGKCGADSPHGSSYGSEEEDSSDNNSRGLCPGPACHLDFDSDTGAGVWDWLCSSSENEGCCACAAMHEDDENDCSTEGTEGSDGHGVAVLLCETPAQGRCWQCTTCGCCRRSLTGRTGEAEQTGCGMKGGKAEVHLPVDDLQAAETSSTSTCAPAVLEDPEDLTFLRSTAEDRLGTRAGTSGTVVSLDDLSDEVCVAGTVASI